MKVGITEHFDSMHRLPGHPKCGVPHGHTYRLDVTVEGAVSNGMVLDFDELKRHVREVVRPMDHTDLNALHPVPTCENLCGYLLERLRPLVGPRRRLTVRLYEGEGKWAEESQDGAP
jgi:6-pyruvoyltetrahydropterin/6-carboxytetrahydropterin synthase